MADFSSETMEARRQKNEIFKVLEKKKSVSKAKLSFNNEGETKTVIHK